MPNLYRKDFGRGWVPSADPVNGPPDGLQRMDNCVLDEHGIVSLRPGSLRLNDTALGLDVKSVYTAVIDGTRYRMAAAGDAIYSNFASIDTGFDSATGVSFIDWLGHVFYTWSTLKKKWDGTTVRSWGIAAPTIAPTVTPSSPAYLTLATGAIAESPAFTVPEGTIAFEDDPTLLGSAIELTPNGTTERGTIERQLATATDYNTYSDSGTGLDSDSVDIWVYTDEPSGVSSITLMVDVNDGSFASDYYFFKFGSGEVVEQIVPDPLAGNYDAEGFDRLDVLNRMEDRTPVVTVLRSDLPVSSVGWSKLTVLRGQMQRVGLTTGKNWSTVKAVRIVIESTSPVRFSSWVIQGGTGSPLNGRYKWRTAWVKQFDNYTAISPLSEASTEVELKNSKAAVVQSVSGIDAQADEVWVYRMGGTLDRFYRVATGPADGQAVIDQLSDIDALILNIQAETDNGLPPDNIVDIEGPYYDRLFALTYTHLYPSKVRNPDSFNAGHAIRVADPGEIAHWVKRAYGGLYVGTSKDIYRIQGDGSEYPDGTVNFQKIPQNVGTPPIASNAVATDGNLLFYLAADGWRAFNGASSEPIRGDTDLLWKGQTRDGISPINITNVLSRFWAAFYQGTLVAITPEGSSTSASSVLYKYNLARGRWYRHFYQSSWRSIFREPDGTLIAGTNDGYVWQLETGSDDGGSTIGVVLRTKVEDCGSPLSRKDAWDYLARMDTGGDTATSTIFAYDTPNSIQLTSQHTGQTAHIEKIETLGPAKQFQLLVTGNFTTFKFYEFNISYRERPQLQEYNENKPLVRASRRRRFGGFSVMMDTLGQATTITPVLDDVDQIPFSLTTSDVIGRTLTFPSVVGRDLWAKIENPNGFELYQLDPIVLEELPQVFKGAIPYSNGGYECEKVLSGIHVRVNTLGAERTFTPILDGVRRNAFTLQTGILEPDDYTHNFTTPPTVEQVAWEVDGDIELYEWHPVVLYRNPCPVKVWDTGPVPMQRDDVHWFREIKFKCKTCDPLIVTPYFDGVAFSSYTVPVTPGVVTIYSIPVGREYKGRQPRVRVTAGGCPFQPYYLDFYYRGTGGASEKKPFRVKHGLPYSLT